MEGTHLWTVAIRNYGLESTHNTGINVSSCMREATDDVMYVEEKFKKTSYLCLQLSLHEDDIPGLL